MAVYWIRRFLALEPLDRWLLARAFISLTLVDLGLRVVGVRPFVRDNRTAAPLTEGAISPEVVQRIQRYTRWIEVASRQHFVRARCLHRSLALHLWLRRDGLPSVLRIGVRKADGALQAHAWVELYGQVVNDTPAAMATFTLLAPSSAPPLPSDALSRAGGGTRAAREP
jgi:hypothetical protein